MIHSILLNKYLEHDLNSNLLKILIDIKRYAKQKIKLGEIDTKLIGQYKGNRQGGVIEPIEFIF